MVLFFQQLDMPINIETTMVTLSISKSVSLVFQMCSQKCSVLCVFIVMNERACIYLNIYFSTIFSQNKCMTLYILRMWRNILFAPVFNFQMTPVPKITPPQPSPFPVCNRASSMVPAPLPTPPPSWGGVLTLLATLHVPDVSSSTSLSASMWDATSSTPSVVVPSSPQRSRYALAAASGQEDQDNNCRRGGTMAAQVPAGLQRGLGQRHQLEVEDRGNNDISLILSKRLEVEIAKSS